MATLRELSKQNFTSSTGNTHEAISAGALQRIADATEMMAKNYASLQEDRDRYRRWYNEEVERRAKLQRQITALKGVITKLKKNK